MLNASKSPRVICSRWVLPLLFRKTRKCWILDRVFRMVCALKLSRYSWRRYRSVCSMPGRSSPQSFRNPCSSARILSWWAWWALNVFSAATPFHPLLMWNDGQWYSSLFCTRTIFCLLSAIQQKKKGRWCPWTHQVSTTWFVTYSRKLYSVRFSAINEQSITRIWHCPFTQILTFTVSYLRVHTGFFTDFLSSFCEKYFPEKCSLLFLPFPISFFVP